jgi:hypothetical protein
MIDQMIRLVTFDIVVMWRPRCYDSDHQNFRINLLYTLTYLILVQTREGQYA